MNALTKDPHFQLSKAKLRLMNKAPFFATMAMLMDFEESPDLNPPTMATDGKTIFWHPQFVLDNKPEDLAGVIAHEVLHRVLKHHIRRGDRDPLRWNIATDYAINQILDEDGFALPEGKLLDEKWRGMTAEQIYNRLPKEIRSPKWGQVMDGKGGKGMSKAEAEAEEIKVNGDIRQAATVAKMQGKLSGSMSEWVEAEAEPRVDWKERIWTVMSTGRPSDFTWSKPNRTMLAALDIYMPGLVSYGTGTVVVAIDTSGSISQDEAKLYLAEINSIIETVKPERAILIQCDTDIKHIDDRTDGQPLSGMKIHGRGGTSFIPPFEWVEKEGIVPQALVYLTDGYGPFPKTVDYPVFWVITSNVRAPFGETISASLR